MKHTMKTRMRVPGLFAAINELPMAQVRKASVEEIAKSLPTTVQSVVGAFDNSNPRYQLLKQYVYTRRSSSRARRAQRVRSAKKTGTSVKLEPMTHVYMHGVLVGINDKVIKLHDHGDVMTIMRNPKQKQ